MKNRSSSLSHLPPYLSLSRQFIIALQFISCEPYCNNICTYKVIVTQLNSNSCRYTYFQLLFVPLFPFLVYWTAFKLLTNATSIAVLCSDVIKFFILSCDFFTLFFYFSGNLRSFQVTNNYYCWVIVNNSNVWIVYDIKWIISY